MLNLAKRTFALEANLLSCTAPSGLETVVDLILVDLHLRHLVGFGKRLLLSFELLELEICIWVLLHLGLPVFDYFNFKILMGQNM